MRMNKAIAALGLIALLGAIIPSPIHAAGWEKYIPSGPGRYYYNKHGKRWVDRYGTPKRSGTHASGPKSSRNSAVVLLVAPPPPIRNVRRTKPRWQGGYVY